MTSSEKTTSVPFYKKRWVKICGGICGFILMFFLLLPFGVKYFLSDWLEKNGADQATIQSFWYNPLTSRITLQGLDVQKGGKSLISNSKVEFDLDLASLFSRNIHIQKAEYRDFIIDLEQYKDGGWRIGSYTIAAAKEEASEVTEEDIASAWALFADTIAFTNCSVVLKMVDLDIRVDIDQAELVSFTTRDGQPAGTFSFKGKINQAPVELQFDTVQIVPNLSLGGRVDISSFNLNDLGLILKDVLQPFSGVAGLDGKVLFSMSDEKGISVDYDGTIDLADPAIGSSAFAIQSQNLSWKGKVQYMAPENGPMLVKTDGLLAAKGYGLQLPDSELTMKESLIELNGQTSVTITDGVAVENNGSFLVEGYEMELPAMRISEESLLWKGRIAYNSQYEDGGLFVDSEGELLLGRYSFEGRDDSIPLATGGEKLSWTGKIAYGQKKAEQPTALELDGTIGGKQLQTTLNGPALQLTQKDIQLITKSSIVFAENVEIAGRSSLSLESFKIVDTAKESSLLSLTSLKVTGLEGKGGKILAVEDVLADNLALSVPGGFPLKIDVSEISMQRVNTEDLAAFTVADLTVKNPLVTAVHNNSELVRLGSLAVKNISADTAANVRAEAILLDDFFFLPATNESKDKTACSIKNATLADISWNSEAGLQGDTLTFDDLVVTVVREKEGNLNITSQLAEMQIPVEEPEDVPALVESADDQTESAPFSLREIVVVGKSGVLFEDYTLAVPYITDLAISQFQINDLDSNQPDQESKIILMGELEKRGLLEITGKISPFKEKLAMKMKLKLRNYPLSSLSSYTVQSVGTSLASGQLKIKSKFELADDVLDMENTITLKKLKTEMISPELAAELDNELPIPLDSALSIIRDSSDNIELDIPLSGPVADLNVGISDILVTALGKAIIPAATGYLMYTLGPYGALAYVGMKVGEKMLQVTLPPVVFVQQELSLTEEHAKYLERVAKILQDKPLADLQICPTVGSWEFLGEEEIAAIEGDSIEVEEKDLALLTQLGQDRAAAIKNHLARDYSIDENRLLICVTIIDNAKSVVPAVLLEL